MLRLRLFLFFVIAVFAGSVLADDAGTNGTTATGLRDSEREYLKKVQAKDQPANKKNSYPQADPSKYEQCQTALQKIDKLMLELERAKKDSAYDTTEQQAKIQSLQSQIDRYKSQAKQFCPKDLLKLSIHLKD